MSIRVKNLVKKYNGHTALDGLDFGVEEGDIFGFLGPNGRGRPRPYRILTGIIKADSGTVLIDGHDIFKEPMAVKEMINALPESSGYYESINGGISPVGRSGGHYLRLHRSFLVVFEKKCIQTGNVR